MAFITVFTPFNIDLEFRIATFGKRFMAWLIDIIIISCYYFLVLRFIKPIFSKNEAISSVAEFLLTILPVFLYQLFFEIFVNGQTIGKVIAGIKVMDMNGGEPTWGQYITRWILCIGNLFVYIIPYVIASMITSGFVVNLVLMLLLTVIYLPDFLSVMISSKSQRLGDLAADTVVIDKRYRHTINETINLNIVSEDYVPMFREVMRLTDRDMNGIRDLLKIKSPSRDTEHYMIEVAGKISKVLEVDTNLPPVDFLKQLLSDYNYFTSLPA